MNLVELLGLDPETVEWQDLGLCRGWDRDFFYEKYEKDKTTAANMDELCLRCPVIASCALYAQEHGEWGLWGGFYWDGTGKPDVDRNAHKSQETLTRIYQAMKGQL